MCHSAKNILTVSLSNSIDDFFFLHLWLKSLQEISPQHSMLVLNILHCFSFSFVNNWNETNLKWQTDETFCIFFQGWMNEIQDYDPETYHPALTHSVFATLEGSCLRLDYPRNNISRRATYDEKVHDACFFKSHCFQLAKSKVRRGGGLSNCSKWVYAPHEVLCLRFRLGNWGLVIIIISD